MHPIDPTKAYFPGAKIQQGPFASLPIEIVNIICSHVSHRGLVSFSQTCKAIYNLIHPMSCFAMIRSFQVYCNKIKKNGKAQLVLQGSISCKRVCYSGQSPCGKLFFTLFNGLSKSVLVIDLSAKRECFYLLEEEVFKKEAGAEFMSEVIPYRDGFALIHNKLSISLWGFEKDQIVFKKVCKLEANLEIDQGCLCEKTIKLSATISNTNSVITYALSLETKEFISGPIEVAPPFVHENFYSYLPEQIFGADLSRRTCVRKLFLLNRDGSVKKAAIKLPPRRKKQEKFKVNAKWIVSVGEADIHVFRREKERLWFAKTDLFVKRRFKKNPRFCNPTVNLHGDYLLIYEKTIGESADLMLFHLPSKKEFLEATPPTLRQLGPLKVEHIDLVQKENALSLIAVSSSKDKRKLFVHKIASVQAPQEGGKWSSFFKQFRSLK